MNLYRDAEKNCFSPSFFPDPGQGQDAENVPPGEIGAKNASSSDTSSNVSSDELDEVRQALDGAMRARYEGSDHSYALWFERLRLTSLGADRAVFACENNLKARIIAERFRELILEALEEVLGYRPRLELTVDPDSLPPADPDQSARLSADPARSQVPLDDGNDDGAFSPDVTFEEDDGGWDSADGNETAFTVIRGQDGREGRLDTAGRVNWGDASYPAANRLPEKSRLEKSRPDAGYPFGDRPGYQPDVFGSRPGMSSPSRPVTQDAGADGNSPASSATPPESRGRKRPAFHDGYTFDNFIVGSSNQMAHAAALRVADNVGMSINPLFIWGPSGLGKTHLMYAIANRAVERDPALRVICVKGEEFMNEMIEAIRNNRNQAFRDKYRKTDMLLIDDIQFIAGKDSTQTEFFHTFDALYEDRKQIIITSDRPPKDLTSLENRIRSRFEAGLLVDIQPPDYELRMAILRDKISQSGMEIPEEVMDFLAKNLQENIRQLEGVVKKLSVVHMVSGNPVTMETVLKTVPEYLRSTEPLSETVSRIIKATAEHYGVRVDDVLGKERKKNIQTARNVSMYLVRTVTGASLPQIAVFFCRDHSTVHSNIAKVEAEIADDAVFEANVDEILKEIRRS